MTAERHVCRVIYDADGQPIGHALMSPDVTDEELAALAAVVVYARRLQAERDAAAERARRWEAWQQRIAERTARLRGEGS